MRAKETSVEARLARLERENRKLKIISALAGLMALGFLLLGAAASTTLVASRIVIPRIGAGHALTFETDTGVRLAELRSLLHGPDLQIYDKNNEPAARVSASGLGGGHVSVLRPGGKPGVNIYGNSVCIMAYESWPETPLAIGAVLGLGVNQAPDAETGNVSTTAFLEVRNHAGPAQIEMNLTDLTPRMTLRDRDGREILAQP